MIRYALKCAHGHPFEAWFSNASAFDAQAGAGEIACPVCGDTGVTKQIMAPAVRTRGGDVQPAATGPDMAAKMAEFAGEMRRHIRENYAYVGTDFAEIAREMHSGEREESLVWGETTPEEAKALIEEGVKAAPIPPGLAPTPPKALN